MDGTPSLRERGRMGNAATTQQAAQRAQVLAERLRAGECLKRAAHDAGVSYRTAKRYKARGLEARNG